MEDETKRGRCFCLSRAVDLAHVWVDFYRHLTGSRALLKRGRRLSIVSNELWSAGEHERSSFGGVAGRGGCRLERRRSKQR